MKMKTYFLVLLFAITNLMMLSGCKLCEIMATGNLEVFNESRDEITLNLYVDEVNYGTIPYGASRVFELSVSNTNHVILTDLDDYIICNMGVVHMETCETTSVSCTK